MSMIRRPVCGLWLLILLLCGMIFFFSAAGAYGASYSTTNYDGKTFTIIHTITVTNPTNRVMTDVSVTVPLMSETDLGKWQTFIGEELSPAPDTIVTNENYGRDATYTIERIPAHGFVKLEQRFHVSNYAMTSAFNFQNYQYDASDVNKLDKKYLQPEPGIECDDVDIISYAQSKTAGNTNPYQIARILFSEVNLHLTYDNDLTEHSARQALLSGKGNCVDYAYLYTACLRAMGIPARIYTGYWYSDSLLESEYLNSDGTIDLTMLKHNWVEFYVSGMGWVVADPTFTYYTVGADGENIKSIDWTRFASISNNNRLVTLYQGEDSGSVTYTGSTAPEITYDSRLSTTEAVSPFSDLIGHWAEADVIALCNWHVPVIIGKTDSYYGVNDSLTRAELVTLLNRVLDYEDPLPDDQLREIDFPDLSTEHWAYEDIQKAVTRGYVVGFDDGTFQPSKAVTRAEMVAILNNIAHLPNESGSPFMDLDINGYRWAKSAIENAYHAGLAKGITETVFAPAKELTRGEAAVFVNRWLNSDYF